jgi:hypothetical protein
MQETLAIRAEQANSATKAQVKQAGALPQRIIFFESVTVMIRNLHISDIHKLRGLGSAK